MIVDPDFLDHWRTGMVADALSDPMAPIYILRLWAHCQERKSDTFSMPPRGLKAQCKYAGDAVAFEAALVDAGFISRDGDVVKVLGWAEKNASLLAAWENGSKGGRPKKNPEETHGKPTGNPTVTHGQPSENPDETDKRREEKRREEEDSSAPPGADLSVCPIEEIIALYHDGMPENPRVKIVGPSRRGAIKARWREASKLTCKPFGYGNRAEGLAAWRAFFETCNASDFMTGKAPPRPGSPPFFADIDWITTPSNFAKILENKYHRVAA